LSELITQDKIKVNSHIYEKFIQGSELYLPVYKNNL